MEKYKSVRPAGKLRVIESQRSDTRENEPTATPGARVGAVLATTPHAGQAELPAERATELSRGRL